MFFINISSLSHPFRAAKHLLFLGPCFFPGTGTGTVLVQVQDVNDVSPKFSQPEWDLEVPESPSPSPVLATLTVLDPDTTNIFAFRVSKKLYFNSPYHLMSRNSFGIPEINATV